MSLIFIPDTAPSYIALNSDISSGSKIAGASYIGAKVYIVDTGKTYVVMPDLTLEKITSGSSQVEVSNFPSSYPVSGSLVAQVSNFPVTYPVSGSLLAEVSNFPVDYPVSGSLLAEVSNFPVDYIVSGSVTLSDGVASIGSVIVEEMPYGGYAYRSSFVSGVAENLSTDAPTQIVPSAGSALSICVTSIMVTNGGALGTDASITSGSGGTTMWKGYVAGGGPGFAISFPVPIVFGQGEGVFVECSGSADIMVNASIAGFSV